MTTIALFKASSSIQSTAIRLGTLCSITHAAAKIGGEWYDASEKRGDVSRMSVSCYQDRLCYTFDVPDIHIKTFNQLLANQYDYEGVWGWLACRILGKLCGKRKDLYCFEFVNELAGKPVQHQAISGCDLLQWAIDQGLDIRYGRFGGLA